MRLLIALPDAVYAGMLADRMEWNGWTVETAYSGTEAEKRLEAGCYDLLILHSCLCGMDGWTLGCRLYSRAPVCPPRILFIAADGCARPPWADCVVPLGVSPQRLCTLCGILQTKPLPKLAAASWQCHTQRAERFLDEIGLTTRFKGRAYAVWLLARLIPSPMLEEQAMGGSYAACAAAFGSTPAAVERCLRVAIEHVFTQGSMQGIERYFGATVDPERGKPTNRAFLLHAAHQLRVTP